MEQMELSREDFEKFSEYIREICGVFIREDKKYLIHQRLEDLVRASGCDNFSDFYRKVTLETSPDLHERIIAAITTHETSFFRDGHPFEALKKHILPELGARIKRLKRAHKDKAPGRPKLRFWSAAAATGQEPYSLAILIHEYALGNYYFGISVDDFEILATDISSSVLAKAAAGSYNKVEISRGLPPEVREKYFHQDGNCWTVNDEIRKMVQFKKLNLADSFGLLRSFDVIFCRNVLIYFDKDTQKKLVDRLYDKLNRDGILILGSSENLHGISARFHQFSVGETFLYRKKE